MLRDANEKPCSNCGSNLRDIIPPPVNETMTIRESRTAILDKIDVGLRYLLATIVVMIGVPIGYFLAGLADLISTMISVGAGVLAFYLGYKALTKVWRFYKSSGG
jgi:hypothetical protein